MKKDILKIDAGLLSRDAQGGGRLLLHLQRAQRVRRPALPFVALHLEDVINSATL